MEIKDILKLDKTNASIRKIDYFISNCSHKNLEYYQAFCYRNIILHYVGKTNDALKALYVLVPEFPKLSDDIVIVICDAIIEITLDISRFDQTLKYMAMKKDRLKVSNSVLGLEDDIKYAIKAKKYTEAIKHLKDYLNDEIDSDEKFWATKTLADLYYELHDYPAYLELASQLEKIYQEELDTNSLINLEYSKLLISDEQGNHIQVIFDANRLLNEYDLDMTMRMKIATLLIKSYIKSKDYRKASIIESNYEEYLEGIPNDTALAFIKVCLDLYTQTNFIASIKHYEDLLSKYQMTKKKVKTKKPTTDIVIPTVKDAPIKKEEEQQPSLLDILEVPVEAPTVKVSTQYEQLKNLFKNLNNLESNTKFRETFRIAMIELEKMVGFNEAYLLYYYQGYQGLDYKKERAYDKRLTYEDVEDTFQFSAITKEVIQFLDPDSNEPIKNIATQELYEMKPYAISIPLSKENQVYASITYIGNQAFLEEELAYETLMLISEMLNKCFIEYFSQQELRANNKKMFFIYENMNSGVKELLNGNIHLSKKATEMLHSFEDMTEEEYQMHIQPVDLPYYRQVVAELYQYLPNSKEVSYGYQVDGTVIHIKETFFPSYQNGNILLYSLLEDVSATEQMKSNLMDLAFVNPTSNLPTEIKLLVDIKSCLTLKKMSLAVIDIYDFKFYEEIYGMNFTQQMILAIGNEFKSFFANHFNITLYHLGFDRYALLFQDINDKRTIDHLLIDCFQAVSKNMNKINQRVQLYFNAGVYRVSKSQSGITAEKILSYAYDALGDAKTNRGQENHIAHYDGEISKERFLQNQLVTHISESIDHGKIGISYRQVVNMEDQTVFAYIARISLDNYDVDPMVMQQVIQRRGLEEQLEKYLISNVSRELKQLRETVKAGLHILIPVSNNMITDATFPSFVEAQQQFYKTTKSSMILIVEDASLLNVQTLKKSGYKIASASLNDVYLKQIDFYIYDMHKNGMSILTEIQQLCKDKDIEIIVSNVNTKEDIQKCIEHKVVYLYGEFYKKNIRMKKVIEKLS